MVGGPAIAPIGQPSSAKWIGYRANVKQTPIRRRPGTSLTLPMPPNRYPRKSIGPGSAFEVNYPAWMAVSAVAALPPLPLALMLKRPNLGGFKVLSGVKG